MFIKLNLLKSKIYKLKVIIVLIVLSLVTGAHGDPIIENDVEDLEILLSQFIGQEPNVVTILDLSGSMGRNYGGDQVGNWDGRDVFDQCGSGSSSDTRPRAAICQENIANLTVCSSQVCTEDGHRCESQEDLINMEQCVLANTPAGFDPSPIYNLLCGGPTVADCANDSNDRRNRVAQALEAEAGLTQCSIAPNPINGGCQTGSDTDPSCNLSGDATRFNSCIQTQQDILPLLQPTNCTGGTASCFGLPRFGSSRMDVALSVLFDILDADNSLQQASCSDPSSQWDRSNTTISCENFMKTPYRDVSNIALGTSNLPTSPGTSLFNQLTFNDGADLGLRFLPMSYAGRNNGDACTATTSFRLASGGFQRDVQRVWNFYRNQDPEGGTPLAKTIGFDDSPSGTNDAITAFNSNIQNDSAIGCRPQFVIVITDGDDSCSGDCAFDNNSCTGSAAAANNSNRRSAIQAVSNIRTYFARNPVSGFKKEVIVFVIGIGINDPNSRRALHAMAIAGGTHQTGIIRHIDPSTNIPVGRVIVDPGDPNSVLPGTSGDALEVFRALGRGDGIDSATPANARLQNCSAPNINGVCGFQGTDIFNNAFFDDGVPFTDTNGDGLPDPVDSDGDGVIDNELDGFAFLVNDADQLRQALIGIANNIKEFSTAGVSPAAPQSSASVALRDRIFLSILTPITTERIWQGRLALYGFLEDPDNPGGRIVADINGNDIFDPNEGVLGENAKDYHWEAGRELAERNLSTDPRNLFTVDPNTLELDPTNSAIKYASGRSIFNNSLPPDYFGISDADVVNPLPDFCLADPPDGIDNCTSDCPVINTPACQTCIKDCIRDKIVDLMSGNTGILPVGDPLGPIGTNCPDAGDPTSGSLDTCSVRLGDVFHSTPVVVGAPSPLFFDVGFQNFAVRYRNRTAVVYAGANDGFLHAFNAGGKLVLASPANPEINPFTGELVAVPFFNKGDGRELFAFAPPSFLHDSLSANDPQTPSGLAPDYRFGDFKTFVTNDLQIERSFFDGSPLIADVFIDGEANGITADTAICPGESGTDVGDPDGEIDICGREWHSILLSGYRNGGGAYMALDVTNAKCDTSENTQDECNNSRKHINTGPDYPTHLWTLFDKNFGNTWSEPTIGRVRMRTQKDGSETLVDRWVMFVGGGLHPTDIDPTDGVSNDFGNAFYVVDIATGEIIFKYARDAVTAPNATITDPRMVCDMPSEVGAFDFNADGYIDIVYVGDTCGRLWRFDVSLPIVDNGNNVGETGIGGSATFSAPDWTGDIAFCANTATECAKANNVPTNDVQPIFFAPTNVLDDLGLRHLIFTTGNRREPSNVNQFGKLYNFVDTYIAAFFTGGIVTPVAMKTEANFTVGQIIELVPQSGITDQFTTQGGSTINNQGEFIVIFPDNVGTPNGEKGIGSPAVINRQLFFTTFSPDPGQQSSNPCAQDAGAGRVFALDYLSGEPALGRVPGAQNLVTGTAAQKQAAAGITAAQGLPTQAQLTFGARGSVVLTVAFSGSSASGGSEFLVLELLPFPTRTQTLFWEEIL